MIEINNLTGGKIDEKLLAKIIKLVLKREKKQVDVSVALVGQEKIKELNRKYRGKNRPTDVLSFLYNKKMGEIVICPKEVEKGKLAQVLIHGVLHLLGYDHKKSPKKMKNKEAYYFSNTTTLRRRG